MLDSHPYNNYIVNYVRDKEDCIRTECNGRSVSPLLVFSCTFSLLSIQKGINVTSNITKHQSTIILLYLKTSRIFNTRKVLDLSVLPLASEERGNILMTSRNSCSKGSFVGTSTNTAVGASIEKHLHHLNISERGGCMQGSAM